MGTHSSPMDIYDATASAQTAAKSGVKLLLKIALVLIPVLTVTIGFGLAQSWWDSRTRIELAALNESIGTDRRLLKAVVDGIQLQEAAVINRETNGDGPSVYQPSGYSPIYTLSIQKHSLEVTKDAYRKMSERINTDQSKAAKLEESLKRRWTLRWFSRSR